MSTSDLMVCLAVLGGIAAFTLVLTVVAVRARRAEEAETLALRAEVVLAHCRKLLVGQDWLWTVWQNTTKTSGVTMLVRDAHDAAVSTVTTVPMPLSGPIKHFEFDGKRYEILKSGPMSKRTFLREAGQTTVLLSADHHTLKTTYFRGDGAEELFTLHAASAFHRYASIRVGKGEIGKLIIGLKHDSLTRVLTLPDGRCSRLEQLFVLSNT
jgi:hypothetical protein